MLAVAVLTITMLGVARNYRRSLMRDREVEMMHRGDQYSRAIKRYYKKNGSYPTSLEQLEKANNIRYLRKRYKDPVSADGTWKLVHPTDIKLTPGLAAAVVGAGQNPANPLSAAATIAAVQNAPVSGAGISPAGAGPTGPSTPGTGPTGTDTSGPTGAGTTTGSTATSATSDTGSSNNAATSGQVLGGGPVLGVVSKSKGEGIHAFASKTKYNEWFFIYDPGQDRGQALVGPYNPNMFLGAAGAGLGNPTPGSPGAPGSLGATGGPGTVGAGTSGIGAGSSTPPSTPAPSPPAPTQ
jgi:type II secretory pathway pseudopilin PulG